MSLGKVYFIQNTVTGAIKIGYASDVTRRFSALQQATDCELQLLHTVDSLEMEREEKEFHNKFSHLKIRGEWFLDKCELEEFLDAAIKKKRDVSLYIKGEKGKTARRAMEWNMWNRKVRKKW